MVKHAVVTFDDTEVKHVVNKAFDLIIDPVDLIEKRFVEGMIEMGYRFEDGKISILQIFAASKIMRIGINMLKLKLSADNKYLCFLVI